MLDYESMTPEQLEKENKRLMAKKAEIRVEQLKINRILTERQVEIEAKAKVESMTDKQREAMKQELSNVGGIKSEEKVESPGAE
jgi:hypothetical protein